MMQTDPRLKAREEWNSVRVQRYEGDDSTHQTSASERRVATIPFREKYEST